MCSALTPDCGHDNSSIVLIGDVYCPNTKCWVNFACTKRLFNLLAEAIIKVRNVDLCARCAIVLLNIKQIHFSCRLVKGFTFLKRTQISSRCYWRCLLSWRVLFQRREKRISWWLCNNSEIPLCLWKVWSLLVCSQKSFYVTRAREDNKNRPNTFFSLLEKDELGTQQTTIN